MSENEAGVICLAVIVIALGSLGLASAWDKQNEVADKFAKECNASGGTARVIDGMKQCLKASTNPNKEAP